MFDGTVRIDGVDASFHRHQYVTEIFEDMVRNAEHANHLLKVLTQMI